MYTCRSVEYPKAMGAWLLRTKMSWAQVMLMTCTHFSPLLYSFTVHAMVGHVYTIAMNSS